jgi:RNA polymerase sigma-70 factor (ECF subfamily)
MSPSDCQAIFALLSEYLDHELPEDLCREIEAHIADCPPCVAFVESLRKTIELCRSAKQLEAPPPLVDSARQELLAAYQAMLAARGASDRSH